MRLGELLVTLGALEVAELDAALQHQVVFGGRLGTNLVELGFVDSDTVAQALARLHGVPAALARHLAGIDPRAVACLPRDVARDEVAVPIAFAQASGRRHLVVGMRDPGRSAAREAIERAVDLEIIAAVAPELALHAALERHYRLRPTQRFAHASPGAASPLPATELDGELEFDIAVDDLDDEIEMPATLELVDLDHSDVARSEPVRLDTRRPRAPLSRKASAPVSPAAAPAAEPAAAAPPAPTAAKSAPRVVSADAADRLIARASERDEVSEAVLAYLRSHFDAGLMLIVKQGLALGFRGFGGRLGPDTIEALVIPLSMSSIFARAYERRALTRLDPSDTRSEVQDRFYKLFPGSPVRDAVVVPIATKGRIISLIYAHGTIDARSIAGLIQVAAATEDAFLRLIQAAR